MIPENFYPHLEPGSRESAFKLAVNMVFSGRFDHLTGVQLKRAINMAVHNLMVIGAPFTCPDCGWVREVPGGKFEPCGKADVRHAIRPDSLGD